jgi:hypothetical protein
VATVILVGGQQVSAGSLVVEDGNTVSVIRPYVDGTWDLLRSNQALPADPLEIPRPGRANMAVSSSGTK